MQIREATEHDIPEILDVLKASLGEISSKKTEAVWRYKHLDNPFGKSLILVAVENCKIIGIRALMKWKWQLGNTVFSALRAVDTATHPAHQGKGIFKKLTMSAIEIAKRNGDRFIFNTPNNQSLPGYLKMDWVEVGHVNIRIHFSNPLNWFNNKVEFYTLNNGCVEDQLFKLVANYNALKVEENNLFTLKSPEYLLWRYENNPLQKYEVVADEEFYIAAYIKKHKYFKELRITEHIYYDDSGLQKLKTVIKELCDKFMPHFITSSDFNYSLGFSGKYGPILTLRDVNLTSATNEKLLLINNWSYSLGDLELF